MSSYLGSTWESLGPQVTSSVSSTSLYPLSPLYSPCNLGSYPSTCPFSPACCCVPRSLPTTEKSSPPPIPSLSAFSKALGHSSSSQKRPRSPRSPRSNNVRNIRCTLLRDFYSGGDIRRNFLNPSATTEYVEETRHQVQKAEYEHKKTNIQQT